MIPKIGRKSFKDKIIDSKKNYEKLLERGYQETPDGLLPMVEIRKAGYIWNDSIGWTIPAEEYIADGNTDRPAGQKYVAVARQYLDWRAARKRKTFQPKPITTEFKFKESSGDNGDAVSLEELPF